MKVRTFVLGSVFMAAAFLAAGTACVTDVSATTFWATNYYYLASSGQLSLMFVVVVAGMALRAAGFAGTDEKGSNS